MVAPQPCGNHSTFKKRVAILAAKGSNICIFPCSENQRSLVVTCVNIDLPISMGFYTPQLVPMFSHQQYQSYPTGARWSIFWSEIPRKFESSKAQISDKKRYRAVQHEVQRCHGFACFYHRICLAKLDTWHTHTATHTVVILATHLQKISTTNRDGG